jgi:flagellin
MVVNTNLGSLSAQRSLSSSGVDLKQAMERLSSGKKINTAADDAAGFAIAERMTAQIRGLNMATKNANDGLSMLATIENATNDVTDMLQRIRELAVQAANDSNSVKDREFLQTEVNSLLQEINRVATQTVYNNKVVLDGTLSGQFQVGTEKGQTILFNISSIDTDALKLTDLDDGNVAVAGENTFDTGDYAINTALMTNATTAGVVGNPAVAEVTAVAAVAAVAEVLAADGSVTTAAVAAVDAVAAVAAVTEVVGTKATGTAGAISILTAEDASNSLAAISAAIEQVAENRASYGALQNRLEYTVSNLMNVAEFTTSARSRIEDADFAAESARLAKAQVLQQTGTAMLAQANAAPQLALQLIRA